jgi:hypothetical protein
MSDFSNVGDFLREMVAGRDAAPTHKRALEMLAALEGLLRERRARRGAEMAALPPGDVLRAPYAELLECSDQSLEQLEALRAAILEQPK